MNKVIPFPAEKSKKMTALHRREARRLALSLTAFSIAAMAIVLSERIYIENRPQYMTAGSPQRLDQLNRAIASARPMSTVEDVDWEHQFAQKLNDQKARFPASVGANPTALDQMQFGPLAGKYKLTEEASMIKEIDYVDSADVTEKPVLLRDCKSFLVDFKQLFSVHFDKAEMESKTAKSQVFSLFDKAGKVVGKAAFQFDEVGQFLSLKVQDAQ